MFKKKKSLIFVLISLNQGGSQSTLQDIKVAEKAGGYAYKDTTKSHNRNRFIYWLVFSTNL